MSELSNDSLEKEKMVKNKKGKTKRICNSQDIDEVVQKKA
jgi:hypothetical protein